MDKPDFVNPLARERLVQKTKRREVKSALVREELRLLLDGEELIADLITLGNTLQAGGEAQYDDEGNLVMVSHPSTRISSLKAAADVKLSLLRKILPDLKAIELTGEDGAPIQTQGAVNPIELITRLTAFADRSRDTDTVKSSDAANGSCSAGAIDQSDESAGASMADDRITADGPEEVGTVGGSTEISFL